MHLGIWQRTVRCNPGQALLVQMCAVDILSKWEVCAASHLPSKLEYLFGCSMVADLSSVTNMLAGVCRHAGKWQSGYRGCGQSGGTF